MMDFREYLSQRKPKYDPEGDFVRLSLRDHDLPDIHSLRQLTGYMSERTALESLIGPARKVWADYVKLAKRQELQARPPAE